MTKTVQIASGAGIVQLPDGLSHDAGDLVTLTDDEFADIDASLIPGTVIDRSSDAEVSQLSGAIYTYRRVINLADLADGDVDTFTPGFVGTVVHLRAVVSVAATTAAKASTLNLEIGTTNLTGGALALTSANMTPAGAVVNATAITAANTFDADDVLTLEAASTTTFIEGTIVLEAILVAS